MKASGTLVASMLVASAVALSSSAAGDRDVAYSPCSSNEGNGMTSAGGKQTSRAGANTCSTTSDKGKFTPSYDGLRFIETLITAHR